MREVPANKAVSRRFPERLFLLGSVDENGKRNVMTIGWCMLTSVDPFEVAVSVCKDRHSHLLISRSREFTLAFPTGEMKEQVLYCGSHSGRDVDKLTKSGLKWKPGEKVKSPLVDGCNANLECKVIGEMDTGSHTIFVGEIVAAYIADRAQKGLYCLDGRRYGSI